jgi:hypothetical protein
VQEIPGLLEGGFGWQGIVPARAAKMGSIAVDKVIAKVGTPRDFYRQLEPERIAEHIVTVFEPDLPQLIDDIMRREHPRLWRDLPAWGRQGVVTRVRAQLPKVVRNVTDEIGEHIDQLLDPKIMVIERFGQNPGLVVSIFREVGRRELRLMVTFGFVFGFLLGVPVAVLDHWFGQWWLLPLMGIVVGWVTNKLGMWLIFEPLEPRQVLGIRAHGLVSSTLVASGLTMIGPRAGVRYVDEVPAYLNNLFRLGLVWFSSEQVDDPRDYHVLEAQPDVLGAMHSVRFPKLVRRSIHLTPFGTNFCRTCLVDPEDVPDPPEHGAPED